MSGQSREQRLVFGEVADLYERYRPGYPDALFDRIVEFASLSRGDRALEIGCGTGRATVPLAVRGLAVTALEPSPEMARIAASNTAGRVGTQVVESSFEDWPLPPEPFRLVTAAQAWHWLRPEMRFQKAHQALGSDGCLGLIWNRPSWDATERDLEEAVRAVYRREAPELVPGVPGESEDDHRPEIVGSGLFVDLCREEFPWLTTYSTDQFLGLLRTQSNHRLLQPKALERLLEGIASAMAGHGGHVDQSYTAFLYLARRRD